MLKASRRELKCLNIILSYLEAFNSPNDSKERGLYYLCSFIYLFFYHSVEELVASDVLKALVSPCVSFLVRCQRNTDLEGKGGTHTGEDKLTKLENGGKKARSKNRIKKKNRRGNPTQYEIKEIDNKVVEGKRWVNQEKQRQKKRVKH